MVNSLSASQEYGAVMAEKALQAIRTEGKQQVELIQAVKAVRPLEPYLGNRVNLRA